jgi:hypothetical protein
MSEPQNIIGQIVVPAGIEVTHAEPQEEVESDTGAVDNEPGE